MYVAVCWNDFGVRFARKLEDAVDWHACFLDRLCPSVLCTRVAAPIGFAASASWRMDEFSQGDDGVSGSCGRDEVSIERRPRMEVGHLHTRRRSFALDRD